MSNRGIDYSRPGGTCNRDPETGIRYGIMPSNHERLTEWFWESVDPVYEPFCPHCDRELADDWDSESVQEVIDTDDDADDDGGDPRCPFCAKPIADGEQWSDEPQSNVLSESCDERGMVDPGMDVWVFRSPYFTRAAFCSPCAPGACYLTSPCDDGARAYCLGPDWFDGKPPYPIYRVDTGELVAPMVGDDDAD